MNLDDFLIVITPGTFRGGYAEPDSLLRRSLADENLRSVIWQWSYDVGGIPNPTGYGHTSDWIAGGYTGRYKLVSLITRGVVAIHRVIVLTHSHGINPPMFQATLPEADGVLPIPIPALISVCAPPRGDMQPIYQEARANGMIGYHRALYADGWDFWARGGQAFDGSWGWNREWEGADDNVGIKGVGHTKLLNDPEHVPTLIKHVVEVCERVAANEEDEHVGV